MRCASLGIGLLLPSPMSEDSPFAGVEVVDLTRCLSCALLCKPSDLQNGRWAVVRYQSRAADCVHSLPILILRGQLGGSAGGGLQVVGLHHQVGPQGALLNQNLGWILMGCPKIDNIACSRPKLLLNHYFRSRTGDDKNFK